MSLMDEYLGRSREIIGERSTGEKKYDNEVLKGLRKGMGIRKAIEKANKKYPKEALVVGESDIEDVRSHYEYLLEHEKILAMLG